MLPALPNVIICGPFPHYLMKTRFRANYQPLDRIVNICSYVDRLSTGRFAGDVESWNTFCVKKKEQVNAALQAEVRIIRSCFILFKINLNVLFNALHLFVSI